MITIENNGTISAKEDSRLIIGSHVGDWEIAGSTPEILLFRKSARNSSIPLAGTVSGEGWLFEIVNFVTSVRLNGNFTVQNSLQSSTFT